MSEGYDQVYADEQAHDDFVRGDVRKLTRRERLYSWLASHFDERYLRLSEKKWAEHDAQQWRDSVIGDDR